MMGKPLVNKKKWTRDEFRLLVVLLLTVVYPVFVLAFFAIFFFVLMPAFSLGHGPPHYYWLIASLIWVVLCAIILPCFRNTQASAKSVGMDFQEGPVYTTKQHAVQPFVRVEEADEKKRVSILTNKSEDSSASIEKGICEEKADKESLEKSREDIGKSDASLEKGQITQSGEFLNECIDSLGPEKLKEEEAECEVHAESEKGDVTDKQGTVDTVPKDAMKKDESVNSTDDSDEDVPKNTVEEDKEDHRGEKADEMFEVLEPLIERSEENRREATPLHVEEGRILESENLGEEQVVDLESEPVPMRKPHPTVDTSRASEYYECSMPTPKSAKSDRPESNMVFLFVNPDIAASEKDVIVNREGEVQEKED